MKQGYSLEKMVPPSASCPSFITGLGQRHGSPLMDIPCMPFCTDASNMHQDNQQSFISSQQSSLHLENCSNDNINDSQPRADCFYEGLESPSNVLQLLWKANSFMMQGLQPRDGGQCTPLFVGRQQVGILLPHVAALLTRYPSVFQMASDGSMVINPQLTTYSSRSGAVAEVLQELRQSASTVALRSWRGENFVVWGRYGVEPLMEVERAAVALLGIRAFGVHITGYVRGNDGSVAGVWLQKRADDKPTYPGMMDTMVGGGITAGLKASEVLYKESAEEASVPAQLVSRATAVGTVSFFTETERGLHANTEHVFDIELPSSFEPHNADGEVQGFIYVDIKDITQYLCSPNYKLTSTPILIDFLVRHGIITSDTVPDLPEVTEMLHAPLSHFYRSWPTFPMSSLNNLNNTNVSESLRPTDSMSTNAMINAVEYSPSAAYICSDSTREDSCESSEGDSCESVSSDFTESIVGSPPSYSEMQVTNLLQKKCVISSSASDENNDKVEITDDSQGA